MRKCRKKHVCTVVAMGGHLHVLKWARKHGCPLSELFFGVAHVTHTGHLEILKWAYEHGCPWNDNVYTGAALGVHLHLLKWAHERGCSWNEQNTDVWITY